MVQYHIDPVNLIVVLATAIGMWIKFFRKEALTDQTIQELVAWNRQHGQECNEMRKQNNQILTELQVSNAKLTQIAESQGQRIDRLERLTDK